MELPPIWKRLQSDHQSHLQGICSISYYTTISAFPTIDHSNCVDVSKYYLACTDRARDVPKHISCSDAAASTDRP